MTDKINHERVDRVNQHTNEGTRAKDFSREHAEQGKALSFIEQPMHDAKLLQGNEYLKKGADGKLLLYEKNPDTEREEIIKTIDPKSLKEDLPSVQYEQIKYNMMKQGVSDATKSLQNIEYIKVDQIKEVEKVEDGYTFKYDLDDKKDLRGKLSSRDEVIKQGIATFEKTMADYGFPIEEPKSDSIKKAVLKEAQIEGGAVQGYDAEHEKWYISKNGKIEEFSLDKQKIEEDAELNGVKKYLEMKNGEEIVDAEFKNDQHDQYKVKGADPSGWETIAKEGVDPGIMKKIMSEKMLNPDSHVTVIESKETGDEAELRKIDKRIDDLKEKRQKLENWGKTRKGLLTAAIFLNQGAAQANQNLNIVEEALQLGGDNNGNPPATIMNSDKVFNAINEKHNNEVKQIKKQIKHYEKLKINVEDKKNKLEVEVEKYKKIAENVRNI